MTKTENFPFQEVCDRLESNVAEVTELLKKYFKQELPKVFKKYPKVKTISFHNEIVPYDDTDPFYINDDYENCDFDKYQGLMNEINELLSDIPDFLRATLCGTDYCLRVNRKGEFS